VSPRPLRLFCREVRRERAFSQGGFGTVRPKAGVLAPLMPKVG
jgi:hypothetical protein